MKRLLSFAAAGLLAVSATAYAAAPDIVVKAVSDCCDLVMSCCGAGGCC